MEAFSILQIPEYKRKQIKRKKLGISIDYKRFNIKNRNILQTINKLQKKASNETNSNVAYDGDVAYLRVHSPRGIAHQVIISVENIGPVPIVYIEEYRAGQGLKGSVARVDLYGAFFHFMDIIPERYVKLYDYLSELSIESPSDVRKTRLDIAIDTAIEFPQNGYNWIVPSGNSKKDIDCYRHKGKYNSFGYLAEKNTSYGIRIYNKILDIEKKGKQNWYGGESALPENWTRIEFEFYPPYSIGSDTELMKLVLARVCGSEDIEIGLPFRPCNNFRVDIAYKYFELYAKNHGITMDDLMDQLMAYHIHYQEMMRKSGQISEKK